MSARVVYCHCKPSSSDIDLDTSKPHLVQAFNSGKPFPVQIELMNFSFLMLHHFEYCRPRPFN